MKDIHIPIIFGMIVALTILLFGFTFNETKYLWFGWNTWFLLALPTGVLMNMGIWTFAAYVRWYVMEKCNFTDQERYDVINSRENFDLLHFTHKYSSFILKCIDGLCRKSNHILTACMNLLFITAWVKDRVLKYQVAFCGQIISILLSLFYLTKNSTLAFPLYGSSSRIRDGTLARFNLLMVRCVSLFAILSIGSIMSWVDDNITEDEENLLLALLYMPTAFGDAAGEIIGSLFGKHEFKVYGLGEINKKSIEGTFAVFFFSIGPMILLLWIKDLWKYLGLSFVLASQSTILELISFRCTDNYVLPVSNALVIYLWTK